LPELEPEQANGAGMANNAADLGDPTLRGQTRFRLDRLRQLLDTADNYHEHGLYQTVDTMLVGEIGRVLKGAVGAAALDREMAIRVERQARRTVDAEENPPPEMPAVPSLDALLAQPPDPIRYRVDRLMPVDGRVILSARRKLGKTVREYDDHGTIVRTEAALMEVSLVGIGAYETAKVGGIRSAPAPGTIPRTIAEARLKLANRGR
jgi:hypothetical protein